MTKKDALNKIFGLIKKTMFADETPPVKLATGDIVQSTLEPGSPIAIVNAEGAAVPAPVGEYELEDARIVVVTEEGIVAEVKEAEPVEASTETPAPTAEAMAAVEQQLAEAKVELDKVKADFSAHKVAAEKFQADTTGLLKQMYELVEILTKEEAGTPADTPKHTVFSSKRADKADAKEKMMNGFKKFAERIKK